MTIRDADVLIAGAGPTGLMLAGELALAGVDVAIVERHASQDLTGARAVCTHAPSRCSISAALPIGSSLRGRWRRSLGLPEPGWTSATFPLGTPTGSGYSRTTSSASWLAESASWRCRSTAVVK
jgi:flavin-dependent dehydrogenase